MTRQRHQKGLIIFIKNPQLGRVKTRLAKSTGDVTALAVYHKLLAHTRNTALNTDCNRYLFYDTAITEQDEWSTELFNKDVQATGDLGERMHTAFKTCLALNDKVVIIGSDCPEITSEIIETAFRRLDLADVVIGPTLDGGYYLLGMKKSHSELFMDMKWSTATVFSDTIERIQQKGSLYSKMPILSDLDNIEDLNKFPKFNA